VATIVELTLKRLDPEKAAAVDKNEEVPLKPPVKAKLLEADKSFDSVILLDKKTLEIVNREVA
jgi:hypothetical protein